MKKISLADIVNKTSKKLVIKKVNVESPYFCYENKQPENAKEVAEMFKKN